MESPPSRRNSELFWAIWAVTAAFGTYFCMYGFRKPFTAAGFEGAELWGIDFKTVAVATQVIGYTLSKFIGIKVIAEMPPGRRAATLLALVGAAQAGLLFFGLTPRPFNVLGLFVNGLTLGMVFGLVIGFLEGRRLTEALTAGLCASFILADGVTKSVGAWLLESGVSEDWMPFSAGLVFLLPLCVGVGMLARVPQPDAADLAARSVRETMSREDRRALYGRYAVGLTLLVGMYLLVTIMRSIRADFAPELWRALGAEAVPGVFTQSEMMVALGVLAVNGCAVFIRDNRAAFGVALATCAGGFAVIGAALLGLQAGALDPFPFMVLVGLGLYLPYVAVHTTVFERLLAMTRERGNLGYLMYVADAFGYLGYVAVMFTRDFWSVEDDILSFFVTMCWLSAGLATLFLFVSWRYFAVRTRSLVAVPEAAA